MWWEKLDPNSGFHGMNSSHKITLFVLILYVPVNNISVMSGWVFLSCSSKQRINVLLRTQQSDCTGLVYFSTNLATVLRSHRVIIRGNFVATLAPSFFYWLFFILTGIEDNYGRLDEF